MAVGALWFGVFFCGNVFALPNLGEGLFYLRLHSLPSDLPSTKDSEMGKSALIVDLRGAKIDPASRPLLAEWLGFRCSNALPTFLLINGDTDASLVATALEGRWPSFLSFAPRSSSLAADVLVDVPVADDNKACELIASGEKLEELISLRSSKQRYDESSLAKDYELGGLSAARESRRDSAEQAKAEEAEPKTKVQALHDLVLARAVHVHRAFLALKPRNANTSQ